MDIIHATAHADALRDRAAELVEAGRITAARPLLAAARALDPVSPEVTLISARIAMASGALPEALEELDGAIANRKPHCGLYKLRADVRQRMGDLEGAARDASEALTVDRHDHQAKAILGAALLNLGAVTEAVACLEEAVADAPEQPSYWETLASALERAGDADGALSRLTRCITLHPGSTSTRNAAILLCTRCRDFKQAVSLAEGARQAGIADACTFGLKGHALSTLGRHDEAAIAYQDALKLGPEDPYVRHLVVSSGAMPNAKRAPEEYIRTVFDGYADRFDLHLIALGYRIPAAIRTMLQAHPKISAGLSVGPVLDLGCGTGMAALALSDLPIGPFIGIDLSPRMLVQAQAKQLYAELREGDIVADLTARTQRWPLILAADVLCYFGALEDVLALVGQRLEPDGWFVFSVEQLLPDRDGSGTWRWQVGFAASGPLCSCRGLCL